VPNPLRIEDEIEDLEKRLAAAKAKLSSRPGNSYVKTPPSSLAAGDGSLTSSRTHFLLLLADSALPLGSFAFSSGLESYLAHTLRTSSSFNTFLSISLASYASTNLPFVIAAHRNPQDLSLLDDALDAAIMCTVGRRASVAQGRALLSIWDRSFKPMLLSDSSLSAVAAGGVTALQTFSSLLRSPSSSTSDIPAASAHLGPILGSIARILGLSLYDTSYVFMLSHVKALISAAVRASLFGPFQAQKVLASWELQEKIREVVSREWDTKWEAAGQNVPVMDLWIGRHELLYSRIFNS